MKRRGRFQRFLIGSAIVIAGVAVLSGFSIVALVERHLVGLVSEHTAVLIANEARRHLAPVVFELGPGPLAAETFESFLGELPGVFRIKVFDVGGRIIWSDKPELIGRAFPDNSPFRRALAGETVAVVGQPKRAEHVYERDRPAVVEVYVPVAFAEGGRVAGVIEAYRDATALVAEIAATRRRLWLVAGAGGLVAYVALAAVAWRAARAELRALGRLESENRELTAVQHYTQSILEPVDIAALAGAIVDSAARDISLHRTMLYRIASDSALSLLAHGGAAGPRSEAASKDVPAEAVATDRPVVRGSTAAFPITTPRNGRYLFVGEFKWDLGSEDRSVLRVLEIMLQEARIALANAELFSEVSQAREQLAAVLSGVTDRMVILDRRMRVLWTNRPEAPGSAVAGGPCCESLGGPKECVEECPGALAILSGRPQRGRRLSREADGRLRHLDVIAAPLPDASGYVQRALEVARDITEIVEMEERLKESSGRVETAHAALVVKTAELEEKNRELVALQAELAARERLAAVGDVTVGLHHAILNPLAGIAGALDVLERGDLPDDVRAAVFADLRVALCKIEQVVRSLTKLRDASGTRYVGETTMLDLAPPAADPVPEGP